MRKYAIVRKEVCIGCRTCGCCAPDIFDFDSDGTSGVIFGGDNNRGVTGIPENLQEELQEAFESCPRKCIQLAQIPFS